MAYTTAHPTDDDLTNPDFVPTLGTCRVYKYPVPLTDAFTIRMPARAQLLDVQVQGPERLGYETRVMLWALVDPDGELEARQFRLAGTGHPIAGRVDYVGTVQLAAGALVLHLFEVDRPYPEAHWVGYGS
jgi:hypothetical protein